MLFAPRLGAESRLFALFLVCACPVFQGACSPAGSVTELVVVVDSDLQVGAELSALRVEVSSVDDEAYESQRRIALAQADAGPDAYTLPLSFSVSVPEQLVGKRISLRVVARGPGEGGVQDLIERRLTVRPAAGVASRVDVFLTRRCLGVQCEQGDTCEPFAGSCEAEPVWADLPRAQGDGLGQFEWPEGAGDCAAGYAAGRDGRCEDVNECDMGMPCGAAECSNAPGTYACGDCLPGFAPAADGECVDIDECAEGRDNCGRDAECMNEPGGFRCVCAPGFTGSGTGEGGCTDIDECALDSKPCGDRACANTRGGFSCGPCPSGYGAGPAGPCEDLDECALGTAVCDPNADCINVPGSYECACHADEGYTASGTSCVDLDECERGTDDCASTPDACLNLAPDEGMFACVCPAGYEGGGVGEGGCEDLDECALGTHTCDTEPPTACTNLPGDFTCSDCPPGFAGDSKGGVTGCVPLLDDLALTPGTLTPAFYGQVESYIAPIGLLHVETELTPTARAGIELAVDGSPAASGAPLQLPLAVGSNPVEVRVQAGGATRTYSVDLQRGAEVDFLKELEPGSSYQFGRSVAFSADGRTLAVGARDDASTQYGSNTYGYGAAHVYALGAGVWTRQVKLTSPAPVNNEAFGKSVALSADGNVLVVGTPGDRSSSAEVLDSAASYSGAVYVYMRAGSSWGTPVKIKPDVVTAGDAFGTVVRLDADGDTLAVGAPSDASGAGGLNPTSKDATQDNSGAAYVFTRQTDGSWRQQLYAKVPNPTANDNCGAALDLNAAGDTLAMGCSGEDAATTGINQPEVGGEPNSGATFVFVRDGSSWSQQAYIKLSDTDAVDLFGSAVELDASGDLLVVGAPGYEPRELHPNTRWGGVIAFMRDAGVWSEGPRVIASNPVEVLWFGGALSLSDDGQVLVVGADDEASSTTGLNPESNDRAPKSGAAYLFRWNGSTFEEEAFIKPFNTDEGDDFGNAVAVSGNGQRLAVGALGESTDGGGLNPQDNNGLSSSGAVYLY